MKHQEILTPWQRLFGLLKLEKRAVMQVFYYAIFAGLVSLSLPLGIQAIINLVYKPSFTLQQCLTFLLAKCNC